MSQGKAINKIKGSTVARDLLGVLQSSQKASQLMTEAVFEFKLDKQFLFHVVRKSEEQPAAEAVATAEEAKVGE